MNMWSNTNLKFRRKNFKKRDGYKASHGRGKKEREFEKRKIEDVIEIKREVRERERERWKEKK